MIWNSAASPNFIPTKNSVNLSCDIQGTGGRNEF